MFPSSRFRRNQQPGLTGSTERVRDSGVTAYPELHYARQQNLAACKRAGNLFAHWRRFTPEFNYVPYCPRCYNPRTKTPVDASCPVCFGTGFEGGYSKPSVQYMILKHSDRRLEATESGFVRLIRSYTKSPYLPNINTGDVLGEIQNFDGVYNISDRYLVEGNVEKIRFRLRDDFVEPETYDHLDPESDVVSYKFEATRIYKHTESQKRDIKYSIPFENAVWLTTIGEE